jgi:hypothetical protein
MALSVADVDRWNAEAVREVCHAATARSRAALGASRELASLRVFAIWRGATSAAAAHQNAAIRQDLDAHGNEALAVAQAARKAADEIDKIKAGLAKLRADAAAAELEVDAAIGQVVAVPKSRHIAAEWTGMQEWRTELQIRLNAIVAEANTVDRELATAITMADGGTPEAHRALPQSLPQDPKRFNDLWNTLTSVEKDWLYSQDHYIGNHPGMPWDPTDHRGKDYYNRLICPNFTIKGKPMLTACSTAPTNWCARYTWVIDQRHRPGRSAHGINTTTAAGIQAAGRDPEKPAAGSRYADQLPEEDAAGASAGNHAGRHPLRRWRQRRPLQRHHQWYTTGGVLDGRRSQAACRHRAWRHRRPGGRHLEKLGLAGLRTRRLLQTQPLWIRPRRIQPQH